MGEAQPEREGPEWAGGGTAKYRLGSEWEGFFLFFKNEGPPALRKNVTPLKYTQGHTPTHTSSLISRGFARSGGDIAK